MDDNKVNSKKCSSSEHLEVDAVKYCKECHLFMCNKCDSYHSKLFKEHNQQIIISNKNEEFFINICKERNHKEDLEFYCKNHNVLCCGLCLCKIKTEGKGQHSNCEVVLIEDIKKEKIDNLQNNIKELEKISKTFKDSLEKLKNLPCFFIIYNFFY